MRKKIVKALLLIPLLLAMVAFAGCGNDDGFGGLSRGRYGGGSGSRPLWAQAPADAVGGAVHRVGHCHRSVQRLHLI